jgi:hypothetical protein
VYTAKATAARVSGGGMFASSNIRVLLSTYFQLPPTEKISGNCTLELRR